MLFQHSGTAALYVWKQAEGAVFTSDGLYTAPAVPWDAEVVVK